MTDRDDDHRANFRPQKHSPIFGEGAAILLMFPLILVTGLFILAAIVVFGFQVFGWLRLGIWTPVTIGLGWVYVFHFLPTTEWVGIQTIIDFALRQPLSIGLFFCGIVFAVVTNIVGAIFNVELS